MNEISAKVIGYTENESTIVEQEVCSDKDMLMYFYRNKAAI